MPIENKFQRVSGKLLEINRKEAASSREWQQIHGKSVSKIGGSYVELTWEFILYIV